MRERSAIALGGVSSGDEFWIQIKAQKTPLLAYAVLPLRGDFFLFHPHSFQLIFRAPWNSRFRATLPVRDISVMP